MPLHSGQDFLGDMKGLWSGAIFPVSRFFGYRDGYRIPFAEDQGDQEIGWREKNSAVFILRSGQ
jgi:hypothetical protein